MKQRLVDGTVYDLETVAPIDGVMGFKGVHIEGILVYDKAVKVANIDALHQEYAQHLTPELRNVVLADRTYYACKLINAVSQEEFIIPDYLIVPGSAKVSNKVIMTIRVTLNSRSDKETVMGILSDFSIDAEEVT